MGFEGIGKSPPALPITSALKIQRSPLSFIAFIDNCHSQLKKRREGVAIGLTP